MSAASPIMDSVSPAKQSRRPIPNDGKGRPPGIPNKIHTDVKKLAQSFGPDAIRKLAEMGGLIPGVKPATPNATQAYALDKLLDRAYGKAPQAHSLEGDGAVLGLIMIPGKSAETALYVQPAPSAVEVQPMIEGAIVRDAVEVECRAGATDDGEVEATD